MALLTNQFDHSWLLPENQYDGDGQYIRQRDEEELLHGEWRRQRKDLEKKFQVKMEENIKVRSGDNRVKFIYRCKGHEILGATMFRFKITLVYRSLLRKWYISPGHSFVPEVIHLKSKLKSGTHHPFSEEIFDIIHDVKCSIDVFMKRLTTVYQFIHDAQNRYKDVRFVMNAIVSEMKITFTENAWPSDLQKSSVKDTIVVQLKLSKNFRIRELAYKYMYVKAGTENEHPNKLLSKLQNFYDYPLEEAFERFITGDVTSTSLHENSE